MATHGGPAPGASRPPSATEGCTQQVSGRVRLVAPRRPRRGIGRRRPDLHEHAAVGGARASPRRDGPLPAEAEQRLEEFAGLVSAALANAQARSEVQTLADEQAALLRVAERVARGDPPDEVFATVTAEARQLLGGQPMTLTRFEEARRAGRHQSQRRAGTARDPHRATRPTRSPIACGAPRAPCGSTTTASSRTPAWRETSASPPPSPRRSRSRAAYGACSPRRRRTVRFRAAPRIVSSSSPTSSASAVGNATSRAQLIASRARVLSTADETRPPAPARRPRRRAAAPRPDGHQPEAGAGRRSPTATCTPAGAASTRRSSTPSAPTDELRELVSGILPSTLTARGPAGGRASRLIRDLPLPVRLRRSMCPASRPEIETTAYFVVAEALTNVVKHARATGAHGSSRASTAPSCGSRCATTASAALASASAPV